MASIKVVLPTSNSSKKFKITNSANNSRTMAYAPREFDFSENAPVGTVSRPGRKPLTRVTGPGVKELKMTQTVANVDWKKDVQADLEWLNTCVKRGYRLKFTGLSSFEGGVWWIVKSMSVKVEQRATNNKPSRAKVTWALIEATDVTVTAGKAPPKPPPKKKVTKKVKKPVVKTYKVKKGDTLWHIARRHLGKATRWPEIFKLNKGNGKNQIKNPHWIYPNQVFKLPPK